MSATRRIQRSIRRSTAAGAVATTGVVAGVAGLLIAGPAGAAVTAGDVEIINRETVSVELDPTGKVETARLYSQLTALGHGTVQIADPSSGKGVRDLDGFSAPSVRDGKAQYSITVDGREDRRTVSEHTGALPITLQASYRLNGKPVDPEDVVGKSGRLEATYTVVNTSAEPTEITYQDGAGKEITETVDLVTPYVASLRTVLPSVFTDAAAHAAEVAGDGKGGTIVSWSLVMFSPLGQTEQTLTWAADVKDAVLPPATLQALPVTPNGNQVLSNGRQTLGDGAAGVAKLTAGAMTIDSKLLELRDGATKILDGLTQLSAGADELNAGLAGEAAPGAKKLADGLDSAQAGGVKLRGGLAELLVGNEALAQGLRSTTGQDDLTGGADKIADGLVTVRDGVAKLVAVDGLPAATEGLTQVLFGLDHAPLTLGEKDPGGLLQGLTAIADGLSHPVEAAGPDDRGGVKEGLAIVLSTDVDAPGLPVALGGVQQSLSELNAKLAAGGDLDQLVGGATSVKGGVDSAMALLAGACQYVTATNGPAELQAGCTSFFTPDANGVTGAAALQGGAAAVAAGVQEVKASTTESRDDLIGLQAGLTSAVSGLTAIQAGVDKLATGSVSARDAVRTQLVPGVQQLVAGLTGALTKVNGELAPGVDKLVTGAGTLAGKLDGAADGARKLADGSAAASQGSSDLVDGLGLLAAGSDDLATGLGDAAEGSGKLADGIDQVVDGVTQVEDGAGRLSAEGASVLASAANDGAAENFKKAAMLEAISAKGADALPYGAPDGATGTAAYSFTLAGADSAAEENTTRGAAALGLLGLGALSSFVIRRRVSGS